MTQPKQKCMTAWSEATPLGEQLVLLEALDCGKRSTDCECWHDLLRQGMRNTLLTCGGLVW